MTPTRRVLLGGLASVAIARPGWAADYPDKFVTIIVPFAPGGSTDFAARIIQPRFSALLGQQVVILNRGGAAGNIGMTDAAAATPDGYTLFLGNVGCLAINPSVYGRLLRVKPERDFTPISLMGDAPDVLIAARDFPPNTVKEMVDYVAARPGKINFGSPGAGSLNRLEMESFRSTAKLDMQHVAYKGGAGEATAAVVSGEVPVMFTTMSSALGYIRGHAVKALAVTAKQRVSALPDVPTMVESGYPDMVASSWFGMLAPAKTPKPVVDKLYTVLREVLTDPEVVQRFANGGVDVRSSAAPAEFGQFMQAELTRWGAVVKSSHITAE